MGEGGGNGPGTPGSPSHSSHGVEAPLHWVKRLVQGTKGGREEGLEQIPEEKSSGKGNLEGS